MNGDKDEEEEKGEGRRENHHRKRVKWKEKVFSIRNVNFNFVNLNERIKNRHWQLKCKDKRIIKRLEKGGCDQTTITTILTTTLTTINHR